MGESAQVSRGMLLPATCVSSGGHVGDHPWEAGALGGLKERRMLGRIVHIGDPELQIPAA